MRLLLLIICPDFAGKFVILAIYTMTLAGLTHARLSLCWVCVAAFTSVI